jgi:hypothetical protein
MLSCCLTSAEINSGTPRDIKKLGNPLSSKFPVFMCAAHKIRAPLVFNLISPNCARNRSLCLNPRPWPGNGSARIWRPGISKPPIGSDSHRKASTQPTSPQPSAVPADGEFWSSPYSHACISIHFAALQDGILQIVRASGKHHLGPDEPAVIGGVCGCGINHSFLPG